VVAVGGLWSDLADLVLPTECAGCRVTGLRLRHGACARCVALLESLRPRPVRPTPAPAGLPDCVALGAYGGALREVLLSYKERGRHGLARPLGLLLAEVVAEAAGGVPRPVLLIPVPDTGKAARQRHGDHLSRLARHTGARLRRAGWPVAVARPLHALPRPDSAALDSVARAAASSAFRLRAARLAALRQAARGRMVIVLDDIVTTGATLAAVARLLATAGVPVQAAALLAATVRRHPR
jgi:predicted amidophosphoribosyltransferase